MKETFYDDGVHSRDGSESMERSNFEPVSQKRSSKPRWLLIAFAIASVWGARQVVAQDP